MADVFLKFTILVHRYKFNALADSRIGPKDLINNSNWSHYHLLYKLMIRQQKFDESRGQPL
ncbi:hypothetical protein LT85_4957 [Collimonas arenae]|uniref:Uncharacterized protein n=1 Tax=Collimonas arenae TaxID=279058 RepID=A0A0A1FK52_9BURK|nr:hypothetical protein LT85_4957 [Collimonas arenae]